MFNVTRKQILSSVLAGGVLLSASGFAFAATVEDMPDFDLGQVIVTANRYEKEDIDTPAQVEVFTNKRLKETGAPNLQEALKYGTGLYYQAQGPKGTSQGTMNSKIVIRGVEKGTLVLLDGVPLNQSGRYNLENISVDQVEKVEVVRGGGAVLYGSEAAGGVINIITKGTRKNSIKTSWGNYGQQGHGFSTQLGPVGLSYNYDKIKNIDNISDPAGGKPVGNYYNIVRGEHNNFDLRYNINKNLFFSHSYNNSNSHYVYKQSLQNDAINKDVIYTIKEHVSQLHYDDHNWKAILGYVYRDQNNNTDAMAKKSGLYTGKRDYIGDSGYKEKALNLDVQKKWNLKSGVALLGGSIVRDTSDYTDTKSYVTTPKKDYYTTHEYERNTYSLYGQYDWQLNQKDNLTFSARETWTGSTQADNVSGQNYSKFTPEVEYLHKFDDKTSGYAKVGQSFMMPTFSQMFGSGNIYGNADLKPQHGTHYEVGVKRNSGNHIWRFALYNYKINDSIESKWKSNGDVYYENEDVRNTGIELTCAVDMGKGLHGNWGVSYSNPQKYSSTTEWGVTTIPRWRKYYGQIQLNGGLSYAKDKWNSAINFSYLGKRTRDIDDESPMRPYLYTSMNINYKPDNHSRIYLNLDNLLDRKDITTTATSSFYTLGRNFMLGYEITF